MARKMRKTGMDITKLQKSELNLVMYTIPLGICVRTSEHYTNSLHSLQGSYLAVYGRFINAQ